MGESFKMRIGILVIAAAVVGPCLTAPNAGPPTAAGGVTLTNFQMACYADEELHQIMKTGSENFAACQTDPGQYPNGAVAGKAFCLFDKLGLFADDDKMKIDWDKVNAAFGSYADKATECKDTNYDTDGGFWDSTSDWFFGEDFDYSTVDASLSNFYSCVAGQLVQETGKQFREKFFGQCPM